MIIYTLRRNLPSAATVHCCSKQTTHGSWHVDKESLFLHPHSLEMAPKEENKVEAFLNVYKPNHINKLMAENMWNAVVFVDFDMLQQFK